jgi:hypothetical protein
MPPAFGNEENCPSPDPRLSQARLSQARLSQAGLSQDRVSQTCAPSPALFRGLVHGVALSLGLWALLGWSVLLFVR